MHILVTNDDGVFAPGLLALAQAMRRLGKISVLAPDRNWSASGHVKTLQRPIMVKDVKLADDTPAIAIDGAPSDCVAMALLGLIHEPIDMVVSGINPYANVGHDLTYSGTVTAAMEAAIAGLPGLAFSVDGSEQAQVSDYGPAAGAAQRVTQEVIRHRLPRGMLLNVNVPALPATEIRGIQVTRQGKRIYRDVLLRREDPRGRPYYWIGGEAPTGVREDGTDIGALASGFISITPISMDMTAHSLLKELSGWFQGS